MKNAIRAMTALVIDAATLTGNYDPFSATGLPHACSILRLVNDSTAPVGVSFDGIDTHEFLQAGLTVQLYFQTNSQPTNKAALIAKGTNVCVIGAAGVGNIYLIGYYQEQ